MAKLEIKYGPERDDFIKDSRYQLSNPEAGLPENKVATDNLTSLVEKVEKAEDGVTLDLSEGETKALQIMLFLKKVGMV